MADLHLTVTSLRMSAHENYDFTKYEVMNNILTS